MKEKYSLKTIKEMKAMKNNRSVIKFGIGPTQLRRLCDIFFVLLLLIRNLLHTLRMNNNNSLRIMSGDSSTINLSHYSSGESAPVTLNAQETNLLKIWIWICVINGGSFWCDMTLKNEAIALWFCCCCCFSWHYINFRKKKT